MIEADLKVGLYIRAVVLSALVWLPAATAAAQGHPNLDFEDGLRGWTATGEAFANQPIDGGTVDAARFPASPLGGDYWAVVPYALGHHGRFLAASTDGARGTLSSDEFPIDADARFFSILIGGRAARHQTRVEFRVRDDAGVETVAWTTEAPGIALLQQRVFAIPPALASRRARLVIVDEADDAGISVDYARFTPTAPRPHERPTWGIADYHAHPMSYLAFGGLRGVSPLWGRPGTVATQYAANPSLFELDLPQCPNDHGGGRTAGIMINTLEKRVLPQDLRPRGLGQTVRALWRLVTGQFTRHPDEGAPDFEHHPGFLSGAHQQMHVTQMHRAWQGGLRLMVAIAVHNEGAEFLASPPREAPPSGDREVLEAQVCGMRRLAALNGDWMQIAYSPADARDIIAAGRLAIVLGAEFDRLGELAGFTSLDEEVQYLWDLGIRQVTPIHGIDNSLGGVAIFEPAYNSLNDLLKRGPLNLGADDLPRWEPAFFDVREGGCTAGALAGRRGECVLFKLSPAQDRVIVARTIFSPFAATPMLEQVDVPRYREYRGHLNPRGLTADGRSYIAALLSRGMLVGLEHMSQRSVEDTHRIAAELGAPLLVSHAHFRALAIQDRRGTTAEGFLPDEHDIADSTVDAVRGSGGVTGVFATENPIETHSAVTLPFANDCAGSSKTFALSLLYGLARMGGSGVGLATDFTFIPQTAPRFGDDACWALKQHWDARPEGGPLRDQYQPDRQDNGIRYDGRLPAPGVRAGNHMPLVAYTMGRRTFDFNVDGLAHYGMLPDLWQDLKNIGVGAEAFAALFSSAEAYITTWERAARVSTVRGDAVFTPRQLACEQVCRGLCP